MRAARARLDAGLHGVVFLVAALLFAPAQSAFAQSATDTARAREARERLRTLGPLVRNDTAQVDSAAADTLRSLPPQIRSRPEPRGRAAVDGLTGMSRDSIMLALLELQGYIATEYKGDTASYAADSARLDLKGAAEVVRQGQRITADSTLTYYEKLAYACAHGSPVVSGSGVDAPIRSDSLCYDIQRNVGVARGAKTEVSEGAVWYVSGDLVTVGDAVYTHDAIFTDCEEDHPHYHFGAGQMKVIRSNVLVARNVTLRFADVPVFWLPFFVQSLSQGRRSGVLMPRFGINDIARNSSRYSRGIQDIGFYWAVSDYMGAEMAMDWQSDNYTALRGSLDYRFLRQFFDGGLTFRQFWKAEGGSDLTLVSRNSWQPDERTRVSFDANYASSSRFVQQRSIDPRELNRSIDSNAGLNRRFDWGQMNVSGQRRQFLSDNSVRSVLPSLTLNLSSITLFPALPGESSWYNNATWTANSDARLETYNISEADARPDLQDQRNFTGGVSSTFSLGKFSLGQRFSLADQRSFERTQFAVDTLAPLADRHQRTADWNTSLSYQQRLIGTTSLTPGLRLAGQMVRDSLDGTMVAGPTRLDFNTSLNTDLFGFYPGIGPFERMRHRLSPNISYSYSPEPTVDERQRRLFQVQNLRERNSLSIGLNQTFEAKYRAGRDQDAGDAGAARPGSPADTLGLGDLPDAALDTATGPRRRETGEKINLLSLSTSALVYDFVSARQDGEGITTTQITNSVQSDLLRGLQLSFTHDLFRRVTEETATDPDGLTDLAAGVAQAQTRREFAPHLGSVNASFSLNSDSWIARTLGLGPRTRERPAADTASRLPFDSVTAGPTEDRTDPQLGMLGSGRRSLGPTSTSPVGSWNASFTYSMTRPRENLFGGDNQMLMANLSLQATDNWSLQWRTGYSFTASEFTDHALTLTRRMHDFDANFDFYKAQNGNFSFQFRVHLRANPDLKLDYEQRDMPGLDRVRR